jgi:hypothetical protein
MIKCVKFSLLFLFFVLNGLGPQASTNSGFNSKLINYIGNQQVSFNFQDSEETTCCQKVKNSVAVLQVELARS